MIDMPTLAFAMCGSFCTFEKALAQLALLRKDWDMLPVMSETAYTTDTRFGTAESFHERIENICGRKIIHTIAEAEPIGPKRLSDAVLVAPCTGNTAAKIANAVTDTAVISAVSGGKLQHIAVGGGCEVVELPAERIEDEVYRILC